MLCYVLAFGSVPNTYTHSHSHTHTNKHTSAHTGNRACILCPLYTQPRSDNLDSSYYTYTYQSKQCTNTNTRDRASCVCCKALNNFVHTEWTLGRSRVQDKYSEYKLCTRQFFFLSLFLSVFGTFFPSLILHFTFMCLCINELAHEPQQILVYKIINENKCTHTITHRICDTILCTDCLRRNERTYKRKNMRRESVGSETAFFFFFRCSNIGGHGRCTQNSIIFYINIFTATKNGNQKIRLVFGWWKREWRLTIYE